MDHLKAYQLRVEVYSIPTSYDVKPTPRPILSARDTHTFLERFSTQWFRAATIQIKYNNAVSHTPNNRVAWMGTPMNDRLDGERYPLRLIKSLIDIDMKTAFPATNLTPP
jgi:hypothetical protein